MASARQGRRVRNTREEKCASSPFAYLTHRARLSLASVRRKTDRRCKIEVLSCSAWVYGLEFLCPFRRVNFWLKTVIEMLREIIRLIFSIYSVWSRNKTKAKLWYEFNHSSSPSRKWLDNACKYWMIISPPFLINYTKKLLILDKITGVPSFTIEKVPVDTVQYSKLRVFLLHNRYCIRFLYATAATALKTEFEVSKIPSAGAEKETVKRKDRDTSDPIPFWNKVLLEKCRGLTSKGLTVRPIAHRVFALLFSQTHCVPQQDVILSQALSRIGWWRILSPPTAIHVRY